MLLFIDTETTGLSGKKYHYLILSLTGHDSLRLRGLKVKSMEQQFPESNLIIKPDSFTIPHGATAIHGITTERAQEEGSDIVSVLKKISTSMSNCSCIVGHNVDFDLSVIVAESIKTEFQCHLKYSKNSLFL